MLLTSEDAAMSSEEEERVELSVEQAVDKLVDRVTAQSGELRAFTVVGVYDDNDQPYCDHLTAGSPELAAMAALAAIVEGDLRILCVFEGHHVDVLEVSI